MDPQSQPSPSPTPDRQGLRPGDAISFRDAPPAAAAPILPAPVSDSAPAAQPPAAASVATPYAAPLPPTGSQRLAPDAYASPEPPSQQYDLTNHQDADFGQDPDEISWTASEFIAHQKDIRWYVTYGGAWLGIAIIIMLITRDLFNTIVVLIAGVIFGVAAGRQPRELQYVVGSHGLTVGNKQYPYNDFRSFSVVDEGHFSSIVFMPLKRFAPPLSIYYHPDDEHSIVEALAEHLPMDTHKPDLTETLMRRIRF